MVISGCLIASGDHQWASALRDVPHDVYATPDYVVEEARRLEASPVAFFVRDHERVFLVPLLLRSHELGVGHELVRDAASPYGYPGIVISDAAAACDGFIDDCIDALVHMFREEGLCSAFVRLHPLLNENLSQQLHRHRATPTGSTVSIDLRLSEEKLWSTMRKGHTNAINQARRAGYRAEIGRPAARLDEMLDVYREVLGRLGASCDYNFGDEYIRRIADLPQTFIAVALREEVVAAAYLFFECDGIVQMHIGGARTAYMKPSPSNFVIHAVALWAKARDDEVLHLGGGVGGSATDSLFTFKSGFSPRRHAYETLRLVADEPRYERLVKLRADSLGLSSAELESLGYFPAYRAGG